jgi:hypothetical protein
MKRFINPVCVVDNKRFLDKYKPSHDPEDQLKSRVAANNKVTHEAQPMHKDLVVEIDEE